MDDGLGIQAHEILQLTCPFSGGLFFGAICGGKSLFVDFKPLMDKNNRHVIGEKICWHK